MKDKQRLLCNKKPFKQGNDFDKVELADDDPLLNLYATKEDVINALKEEAAIHTTRRVLDYLKRRYFK